MAPRFLSDLGDSGSPASGAKAGAGQFPTETQLTMREQEILRLVARGFSNSQIAVELLVSENTVKSHVNNILGKLHMKNRSEAANYAGRLGLTQPPGLDSANTNR